MPLHQKGQCGTKLLLGLLSMCAFGKAGPVTTKYICAAGVCCVKVEAGVVGALELAPEVLGEID